MTAERRAAPLAPGGIIGIVGGGQLGRMAALAAARLGYRCHIYDPDPDCPAAQVAWRVSAGAWDDWAALDDFAARIDVATFEFENIPHESVQRLEAKVPVRPGWKALRISQDRVAEKDFISGLGIGVAPYAAISDPSRLAPAAAAVGLPAILKTARLGYDGKGQIRVDERKSLEEAWRALGQVSSVLEAVIDFECEISVITARGLDGAAESFVPVENRHVHHILDTTIAPAPIPADLGLKAQETARRIAEGLGLVGLLAVEMFVTRERGLLVNEIAPRPHNSGHWTIDACETSQFEQFIRAVTGLPLGSPERHSDAIMKNLIGDAATRWRSVLDDPHAKLHLYGKNEIRPGRKMGHVTWLRPRQQAPVPAGGGLRDE